MKNELIAVAAVAAVIVRRIALAAGYSEQDVTAGIAHFLRKERLGHPPGHFDKAGRFEPSEQTNAVQGARPPSRAYPYSRMKAARTASHCAEVFGAVLLHVKRVARAIAALDGLVLTDSNHGALEAAPIVTPILKRVRQP